MRVGIASDSHDNIPNLRYTVEYCNSFSVSLLIHCGDLISPFMLEELARFGGAVHLVYGNNVGDVHLISQACGTRYPAITHHGNTGTVEAGGLKIAFTHYPETARGIACRGNFDIVCYGHNHRYLVNEDGSTMLVNPGELLGKDDIPGFCILDTATRQIERVPVGKKMFA